MGHLIQSGEASAGKFRCGFGHSILRWLQEESRGQKTELKKLVQGLVQTRKEKTEIGCDGSFLYIGGCFKEDGCSLALLGTYNKEFN